MMSFVSSSRDLANALERRAQATTDKAITWMREESKKPCSQVNLVFQGIACKWECAGIYSLDIHMPHKLIEVYKVSGELWLVIDEMRDKLVQLS